MGCMVSDIHSWSRQQRHIWCHATEYVTIPCKPNNVATVDVLLKTPSEILCSAVGTLNRKIKLSKEKQETCLTIVGGRGKQKYMVWIRLILKQGAALLIHPDPEFTSLSQDHTLSSNHPADPFWETLIGKRLFQGVTMWHGRMWHLRLMGTFFVTVCGGNTFCDKWPALREACENFWQVGSIS